VKRKYVTKERKENEEKRKKRKGRGREEQVDTSYHHKPDKFANVSDAYVYLMFIQ